MLQYFTNFKRPVRSVGISCSLEEVEGSDAASVVVAVPSGASLNFFFLTCSGGDVGLSLLWIETVPNDSSSFFNRLGVIEINALDVAI